MGKQEFGQADFGQGGLNDGLDVDSLVDEIGLDEKEIGWRKEFVDFDDEDIQRLESYSDVFAANAGRIADDFYENITDHEETVEILSRSPKGVEQLKRTQSAYLVTLTQGEYGQEYFRNRARIGKIHDRLDMPMHFYIGQYSVYYDLILPLVGKRLTESLTERLAGASPDGGTAVASGAGTAEEAVSDIVESEVEDAIDDILAVFRLVNLDMQVVTDTYIHSYNKDLESELERQQQVADEVEDAVSEAHEMAAEVARSSEEISVDRVTV
ncbi:protoglobin domain-containing protein [Natronomonas pharaonis]|uniref:protoglobin domain-containing protein n=1 Tax=Natronomonas pharaonis TaxID=2257 RepID=UPI00005B8B52|nr:protoglobin domain-containing protein [Natronomonas pharaonis]